ncbi:hypothetical protein F5Y11DRAFT_167602 [Daldinia sp. FL1419]|nr:hypothetical protein F5Y11DRAFT_167602 [Daldinia sp. FL1419]
MSELFNELEESIRATLDAVSMLREVILDPDEDHSCEALQQELRLTRVLTAEAQTFHDKLSANFEALAGDCAAKDQEVLATRQELDGQRRQLEEGLAALETRKQEFENDSKLQQKGLDEARADLERSRAELEEGRAELENYEVEVARDSEGLAASRQSLFEALEAEKQKLNEDRDDIRSQRKILDEDRNAHRDQVQELREDRVKLNEELDAYRDDIASQRGLLDEERKLLDEDRKIHRGQVQELGEDIEALKALSVGLRMDLAALETQRAELDKAKNALAMRESQLLQDRNDLERQKLDFDIEKKNLSDDRTVLGGQAVADAVAVVSKEIGENIQTLQSGLLAEKDLEISTCADKMRRQEDEIQTLSSEVEELEDELARAADRREDLMDRIEDLEDLLARSGPVRCSADADAKWQHVSDDIAMFLSRFRPSIEEGCAIELVDVVLRILPYSWPGPDNENIEGFLDRAESATWYCFEQVLEYGAGYPGSVIREAEPCDRHDTSPCLQMKLVDDDGEKFVVFRKGE